MHRASSCSSLVLPETVTTLLTPTSTRASASHLVRVNIQPTILAGAHPNPTGDEDELAATSWGERAGENELASTSASWWGRMNRTPDTFATLPRDEMATLLAHAYAAGFDRAACDAALSRSKPLPEWCRAEVLLHHDMSRQIFTHVPLRDGRSVSATCKTWASTFWLQESTADADWVITHQGGILQLILPSLKSARRRYLVGRTRTIASVYDEDWVKTNVEPKLTAHDADAFIGMPSDVELPEVKRTTLSHPRPGPK